MKISKILIGIFLSVSIFISYNNSTAANWPAKPISLIVAWSAGGGTDRIGRSLSDVLAKKIGVAVAVINRPGGTGVVGHTAISQAKPDGYTIGFITPQLLTGPILGLTKLSYKDVTPLSMVNGDPGAVTVKIDAPWKSLNEFIEYAKNNPKKIRIGNSGPGGTWHMVAVSLERAAGIEVIHTPYNGAAPAITDVLGGHIEAVTVSAAEVGPQVENKLLKILAVTASDRLPSFPDVPTTFEQGYKLDLGTWRGLAVPNNTPEIIINKLKEAIKESANDQRFKDFMKREGFGIRYMGAKDFSKFLETQTEIYKAFYKK